MIVVLAIVAVLAVVFLVMFFMAKSSGAEFRRQADERETALVTERDKLKELSTNQTAELTDASDEINRLTTELSEAKAEATKLGDDLTAAKALSADQVKQIEAQAAEIESLETNQQKLAGRVEAAEAAASAAAARNVGIAVGETIDLTSPAPETLWALELLRTQRTWQTSVAPNPSDTSDPFEGIDDPVRRAVEISAAALREDVGAFITIDWQVGQVTDPARQHLVVRVAQELLEGAARCPEPSRLLVSGDADTEVTLRLEAADEGAEELGSMIPPRITSDLVDVRTESGLTVGVKTG